MAETGVPTRHGTDLTIAFKQDAVKGRYTDWGDLMGYCDNSAAPVGRYLLALHNESDDLWPASDALCNALQVLNHLQDLAEDYRELDRVYVPGDWLAEEGIGVEALAAPIASPALRRVIDRMLERTEALILIARTLPPKLKSLRLAMESAVIVTIAETGQSRFCLGGAQGRCARVRVQDARGSLRCPGCW
jgi:phytoene/squalene synthetase